MSHMRTTQMDELSNEKKLLKAVKHVLTQVIERPKVAYLLGFGTQSFSLLTEAYASATKQDVKKVRENILEGIQEAQGDENES